MIRFTGHPKQQMAQRGVTEDEAISVLSNPAETIVTRANRFASYNQTGGKYIVVIHEQQYDDQIVITALKVNRTRLHRFGFTKV